MQLVDVLRDDLPALLIGILDILADFLINLAGNLFRVIALIVEIASQKHLVVMAFTERNRPQHITHAVLRDHAAHDL